MGEHRKKAEAVWPAPVEISKMRRSLARRGGSRGLPPDASGMDRAKYDLCRQFVKLLREEELTQRQLATQLGTSEARVSEIVHYRIDKLTVEQLIRYWEKVRPNFKLKLG